MDIAFAFVAGRRHVTKYIWEAAVSMMLIAHIERGTVAPGDGVVCGTQRPTNGDTIAVASMRALHVWCQLLSNGMKGGELDIWKGSLKYQHLSQHRQVAVWAYGIHIERGDHAIYLIHMVLYIYISIGNAFIYNGMHGVPSTFRDIDHSSLSNEVTRGGYGTHSY